MHYSRLALVVLPIAAWFTIACGGQPGTSAEGLAPALNADPSLSVSEADVYTGPTVGAAKGFAALAYHAIKGTRESLVTGNLGVSGAPVSNITGFDALSAITFGTDSSAPNNLRTMLTQREVDRLVDSIEARPCDTDYTNGGEALALTGSVTLHPGVTCMNGLQADAILSGSVIFDAGGDPNAFFVVRSDFTLSVADVTSVSLVNGAQGCGVFWLGKQQVTIGKNVSMVGTVIAGTGLTMHAGSTLVGRALARSADVVLDGSSIVIPVYDPNGSARTCTHLQ